MMELIKKYLDWKGTYAPRASVNYKIWLERFIQVCGEKLIEQYSISDYVKYKYWLETRFNPYSVQFAIVVIKNFFKFYRDQNYLCLSPTFIKTPKIQAKSHRAINEAEFRKIISITTHNGFLSLRDSVMIRLLWDTGVRVSELCSLEITQIDENKRSTVIRTKKTGKPRIIVWSEETHHYLMKYMRVRLELDKTDKANSLFVGWIRNKGWSFRMTSRTVQRIIRYYVNRAGIKERITPHSFRHGWAHQRRDQNAPLAFIQRGLGHASPISTFIYEQYDDVDFVNNAKVYL